MKKIIEQVTAWEFLKKMPPEIFGFTLINELMTCGSQYRIFTYNNQQARRSFTGLYDEATKDFLVRVVIGLTEYCDISFFTPDLAAFEKVLTERMEKVLQQLAVFDPASVCTQITGKKVLEWPYATKLPEKVAGFTLFITPDKPIKALNGSYVIIDYSDFAAESNLTVNYNIFRDDFFSEIRLKRVPIMTTAFDAKTLPDLEIRLNDNLIQILENIRLKLAE
ncbi:hypothetical protein SOV_27940 [Sporomusa ovata DSM 2662]|uniref:Uncharacterized protein n=1 Tax=Sporomusa ovata TaxID=2378 RepID=A0A0U1L4T5_9FIRM|nr:hypothetical protein [Sporomusa ovata]EQB26105.1 hypothetical protein SOV_4c07770 [Sporomusa ovata DSM 2662]CQR74680.1 hypothetical protein SpAn4DRAFT_1142 [Sporomusa ovata]